MDTRLRFLTLALCALAVSPFALAEETTTETPAMTETATSTTSCDGLKGLKRSLCQHEEILKERGETVPDCTDLNVRGDLTGVKHAYCTIWENTMRKQGEAAAKEKKLEHKMLKTAKKKERLGKMMKKGMKKELQGRMQDALKQKRMETDEVKSESRKERMKMRREEGAVLEGARSGRLHTEPYRAERTGVRRHLGGKVRTPRDVSKTGKEQLKGFVRERSRK